MTPSPESIMPPKCSTVPPAPPIPPPAVATTPDAGSDTGIIAVGAAAAAAPAAEPAPAALVLLLAVAVAVDEGGPLRRERAPVVEAVGGGMRSAKGSSGKTGGTVRRACCFVGVGVC